MSKKVTVTLGPVISAANSGRGVTWETSQQNGSGHPVSATGARKDMLKVFKGTVTDRVSEGFTVEAKVLTAAGQLEEHATYRPDGTATWHHVPPPAGEGAFGRRCRDLGETPLARKQRREATAPPKPAPAPKAPRQRAAPSEKPAKEPKPRVASKPAVEEPAKEPKPKGARTAAAEKPAAGRRAVKASPADDPMGTQFDKFVQFAMTQQPAS